MYLRQRTYQRTVYRPGEIAQFDVFEPKTPVPVGYGQRRRAWLLVLALCFSRAMAGALVFSKEAPDVLWGVGRCLWRLGGLPELLVTDREGCLHAGGGRPTEEFASFCGQLAVGWHLCDPGDAEAKGLIENRQRLCARALSPAGRSPTTCTSRMSSTAGSTDARTAPRTGRCAAVLSTVLSRSWSGCGRCPSGCAPPTGVG